MFKNSQKGSAPLYIALIVALLIVGAAVLLSGVLGTQLKLTRNIISSEKAFYAANSGVEEALYKLAQQNAAGEVGDVTINDGEIVYGQNDKATYQVQAKTIIENGIRAIVCISSLGEHVGDQRRLNLGPSACRQ